ncbi:MAG: DUF4174 domain-containing protein [Gemmatimonadales bacterium]|jgi:hypothetical protein|nr:MAG: DUF4174 domain-containing protein [Gemmatimonadales bacterium]
MSVGLDLDQYQLKKRVLLVFAPNPSDARYREQRAYLEEDAMLADEWRIAEFGIFEDGPSFAEERALAREESSRARADFGVEAGAFGLRLLDLDGTEILRSSEPVPLGDFVELMAAKAPWLL